MTSAAKKLTPPLRTSTDHDRLWRLIQSGQNIPAWIEREGWDGMYLQLVEVCGFDDKPDGYSIGYPGMQFGRMFDGFDGFMSACADLRLQFAAPPSSEDEWALAAVLRGCRAQHVDIPEAIEEILELLGTYEWQDPHGLRVLFGSKERPNSQGSD